MNKPLAVALLLLLAPLAAGAQDRRGMPEVPRDVERRVRAMQADATARRYQGPTTIGAGEVITVDVIVDGTLTLRGRIDGDLLVTRGDLVLEEGAAVHGDVLVVGGEIIGAEDASLGGTLRAYGVASADEDRHDPKHDDDHWHHDDEHDDDDDWRRRRESRRNDDEGGLDLGLSIAGNYNRVEGLPVMFGPVIETAGENSLRLSGQAIWRTEPSRSLEDEIGYEIRAEQRLFGGALRLGGEYSSRVRAIETRGLNSTEAGLAAALFHSDLHDYYAEQGWAARLELRPPEWPVEGRLVFRQAEHGVLEESDPWSLFRGGHAWRPQPIVATGDVRTLQLGLRLDTRDDEDEPMRGLYGSVVIEHALDQNLSLPMIDFDGTAAGGTSFEDFTIAHVDLRAHLPVNRSSTLNLRGVVAGSLEEAALPPQFQRAFGGIGTMPGFGLFEGDCGARAGRVRLVRSTEGGVAELSAEPMLPTYGCDRMALGQLEYRGGFDTRERHRGRDHDHDFFDELTDFEVSADWTFFVDVARGWAYGDLPFAERMNTETMADVGFGVLFDQLGVYVALPITGDDQSIRTVVRLQRRF